VVSGEALEDCLLVSPRQWISWKLQAAKCIDTLCQDVKSVIEFADSCFCIVMALPMKLTWNLQMPQSKKVGILLLFASGVFCILFASLRVVQVAINDGKPEADAQRPDPTWLAIWGMVKCAKGTYSMNMSVTELISY
jgi:hypothetical protein